MTLVQVRGERVVAESPNKQAEQRGEADLVEALLSGDRSAAEQLAAKTYGQIFGALFKLSGDRDLAADLTQETYRKAWTSLGSFRRGSRFSTWLYRIAYNTFLSHVRRPRLMQPLDDRDEHHAASDKSAEQRASDRQLSSQLRQAVLQLPEPQRFVVAARFWGEIPVREIAEEAGITPVAVRKRLRKAMQHLQELLSEPVADSAATLPDHHGQDLAPLPPSRDGPASATPPTTPKRTVSPKRPAQDQPKQEGNR